MFVVCSQCHPGLLQPVHPCEHQVSVTTTQWDTVVYPYSEYTVMTMTFHLIMLEDFSNPLEPCVIPHTISLARVIKQKVSTIYYSTILTPTAPHLSHPLPLILTLLLLLSGLSLVQLSSSPGGAPSWMSWEGPC